MAKELLLKELGINLVKGYLRMSQNANESKKVVPRKRKNSDTVVAQPKKSEDILNLVLKCLEDGKASDVVTIPLAGKSNIADYMVIASGSSGRQVIALAENISLALKKAKVKNSIEGKAGGQWLIVDALDVIVHIFYPETRTFYALEEIWNNSPEPSGE